LRWAVEPWQEQGDLPVFCAHFTHSVHNWRLLPDELAPFVDRVQAVSDDGIAAVVGLLPEEWGLALPARANIALSLGRRRDALVAGFANERAWNRHAGLALAGAAG
jgi:hypothetical protein